MKTTIDIPESELRQAMKYTGAKTKKDAIVFALKDFNTRQRLARLAQMLGTFEDSGRKNQWKTWREDEKWDKIK